MNEEEIRLAMHVLRRRGYKHFRYYGNDRAGYTLLARRHPPLSFRGIPEHVLELQSGEDLGRYLRENAV